MAISTSLRISGIALLLIAFSGTGALAAPVSQKSELPKLETRKADSSAHAASGIARLRSLVEAAEKAIEAEDWDVASDRVDEAETLIADWAPELLGNAQVTPMLDRLKAAEEQLDEDESQATPEDTMITTSEVVPLAGDELRKELEQVQAAEQGAEFDFPIDLNDKVLAWVHLFTTERKRFVEGALSRATRYLPMARQIFAEEGVPQDLAYLALIESGFKNNARSYAAAVGMWQFIRSTGRIYGLGGNAWVEERMDPVKAARASARYLKRLYQTSGDWYLALVGYNAGPMTTERAIQNLGTRNFWDMARSRYLRTQTKNYVPELLAAILVGHYPERYGLTITPMEPYAFETVQVDKMTSLSVLANFAGTDVIALRDLNPELLRATTPPGTYTLRVPPGTSGITARALAKIPSSQRLDFGSYTIRRGDTLKSVAARFNMTPEDLLASNNLSKGKFKPGRRIQVPPPASEPVDRQDLVLPREERAAVERLVDPLPTLPGASTPEQPVRDIPGTEVPAPAPPQQFPSEAAQPQDSVERTPEKSAASRRIVERPSASPKFHKVKSGETLYSIGTRYGLDPKDLRKWNKVKGNKITVGQKLRLQKH